MDEDPPTVNKWDGNAIKNALDDATKNVSFDFCFINTGYAISVENVKKKCNIMLILLQLLYYKMYTL